MKCTPISVLLAALSISAASAKPLVKRASPTIYACGDSTMAQRKNADTNGWGEYLGDYTTIPVVNKAIGGRSARSFTEQGRFAEVIDLVVEGDIVLIEFGHNDAGSPRKDDNARSPCPGTGDEVCRSDTYNATVYTFVHYITQAARQFVDKGATVVLSTQTPNNPWESGEFIYYPPRFVEYMRVAAEQLSDPSVTYVDHYNAGAFAYLKAGLDAAPGFFPNDHTHTSPSGAELMAKAFVQAIGESMNGTTSLADYIVSDYPIVY